MCACLAGTVLTGCNHQATGSSPAATEAGPAKPAASADDTTWGNYLAAQGKIHAKDIGMRPYIYVIPGGDSAAANTRRQEETDSIRQAIGPILIPGALLILGGPNGQQTSAFVTHLAKPLKADALKDRTILVVGDASQESAIQSALKPTGATVRFVAM